MLKVLEFIFYRFKLLLIDFLFLLDCHFQHIRIYL